MITPSGGRCLYSWWRHKLETFSALLAICAGNSPVTGEFPKQRPVKRSFDVLCAWIIGWVSNGGAGDLRRHRAHYDVTVMSQLIIGTLNRPLASPPIYSVTYHDCISYLQLSANEISILGDFFIKKIDQTEGYKIPFNDWDIHVIYPVLPTKITYQIAETRGSALNGHQSNNFTSVRGPFY